MILVVDKGEGWHCSVYAGCSCFVVCGGYVKGWLPVAPGGEASESVIARRFCRVKALMVPVIRGGEGGLDLHCDHKTNKQKYEH
ncbi:hypothetical protein LJC38_02170 [Parabacteroides sp. OttesenSCG-928-K15]|nr:hypothetical protein [Parabacteroides sp. OttesenSCG-928-K15]